ncbi:DsbA family oxidoreductase [Actinacidiphila sp. bgisy160]|uniref:DsbA family oxidoreductase n=1 Tax=Actinacidiphila sp. bgisy160 TaxID=3413796 RepID=UPI003D763E8A
MSVTSALGTGSPPRIATAEHWFDFICPYCYVAQDRTRILREHGIHVVGHALWIHPRIGPGGIPAGPRTGPGYSFLARRPRPRACRCGGRTASATRARPWRPTSGSPRPIRRPPTAAVFAAYFADGLDIESEDLLVSLAGKAGGNADGLRAAWRSSAMTDALAASRSLASRYGVRGTPTWVSGRQGIAGLRPREWFRDWAAALTP